MVWEVVFGVWVGWNARDAATLRRMLPVQRALADVLHEGRWTPLADVGAEAPGQGLFASLYETDDLRLWTIASRSDVDRVLALPAGVGGRWIALHDSVVHVQEAPSLIASFAAFLTRHRLPARAGVRAAG